MTGQEIIERVKALNLPADSYVVFGSCPLALAGIREAQDIDLYVRPEVLERFIQAGWKQVDKGPGDKPHVSGVFEAHTTWGFSPYAPTLIQPLQNADVFEGVAFASLKEVRKWKVASGGKKHEADVHLIDDYISKKHTNTP